MEVCRDAARFHFGLGFDEVIPRFEIENAAPYELPWWVGIGWHLTRTGTIGFLGSPGGVVAVDFATI